MSTADLTPPAATPRKASLARKLFEVVVVAVLLGVLAVVWPATTEELLEKTPGPVACLLILVGLGPAGIVFYLGILLVMALAAVHWRFLPLTYIPYWLAALLGMQARSSFFTGSSYVLLALLICAALCTVECRIRATPRAARAIWVLPWLGAVFYSSFVLLLAIAAGC